MEKQDTTKLDKAKRLHRPVIESMKTAGYGLMLDGETFYKQGYELDPCLSTTFDMRQAYEIHAAVTQARRDELEHMEFLDHDGKKTYLPFNQFRSTKDGLLVTWDERLAALGNGEVTG